MLARLRQELPTFAWRVARTRQVHPPKSPPSKLTINTDKVPLISPCTTVACLDRVKMVRIEAGHLLTGMAVATATNPATRLATNFRTALPSMTPTVTTLQNHASMSWRILHNLISSIHILVWPMTNKYLPASRTGIDVCHAAVLSSTSCYFSNAITKYTTHRPSSCFILSRV